MFSMRRRLRIAGLAIVVLLGVFAGVAFWALHSRMPSEPRLPGKIERGALAHGGRTRRWIAYLPAKLRAHPALVIALHGSMGSPARAREAYGYDFDLLAEANGFIAVYPQGYEGHWNDCRVKGPFAAKAENVDDVGFLHALDGLVGPPATTQFPDIDPTDGSTAERRRWIAAGKRNVTLISILGGGHAVPHPEMHGPLLLGNSNRDFHAANEIWEFFQQA